LFLSRALDKRDWMVRPAFDAEQRLEIGI
jgi:hypothetical protein